MKADFKKRLCAFFIDMAIVGIVLGVIIILLPKSENVKVINQSLNTIYENVLDGTMPVKEYMDEFMSLTSQLDKETALQSVCNAVIIIGYFVVFAYINDGKTFGKQIMKIKIVRKDGELLTIKDLLIRAFFNYGLLSMMVSLALVYVLPAKPYFIITSLISFLQILIIIASVFMVLYRKDKRSLSDIFSKTRVIRIEKEV